MSRLPRWCLPGYGHVVGFEYFDTPPLVTDATSTTGELKIMAAYRAAVAGAASIIHTIQQNNESGADTRDVLLSLAQDLGMAKSMARIKTTKPSRSTTRPRRGD